MHIPEGEYNLKEFCRVIIDSPESVLSGYHGKRVKSFLYLSDTGWKDYLDQHYETYDYGQITKFVGVRPKQQSTVTSQLRVPAAKSRPLCNTTNILTVVRSFYYGVQKESVSEKLSILQTLMFTFFSIILTYVGLGVKGIIYSYTISYISTSLLGLIYLFFDNIVSIPSIQLLQKYSKRVISYGGIQVIGGLAAMFLYKTDVLLMSHFHGPLKTAQYNAAIIPAEFIWFIPSIIQAAFLQRTAKYWSESNIKKINEQLKIGIKYGILSLSLFGIGLFGSAFPFIYVYFGPEYTSAVLSLKILILGTFFFGLSRVSISVFQATGWVKYTELVTVLALCLNIFLNYIFIPTYGLIGAAISTSLSYIVIFVGNMVIWKISIFNFPSILWVCKIISVQLVFGVFYISVTYVLNLSPFNSLMVSPLIGLIVFLSINMYAGIIDIDKLCALFYPDLE